jgi:hypothetical protein
LKTVLPNADFVIEGYVDSPSPAYDVTSSRELLRHRGRAGNRAEMVFPRQGMPRSSLKRPINRKKFRSTTRHRFFVQKAGTTGEPATVGSSSEPLFVIERLEAGARYHVFVSAVNLAGNEGPRSKAVSAEVIAKAA